MSAPLRSVSSMDNNVNTNYELHLHYFFQQLPVPSYAIIIAVGVLQEYKPTHSRFGVWFDNYSYSQTADQVFSYLFEQTELILNVAKNICGESNVCGKVLTKKNYLYEFIYITYVIKQFLWISNELFIIIQHIILLFNI